MDLEEFRKLQRKEWREKKAEYRAKKKREAEQNKNAV